MSISKNIVEAYIIDGETIVETAAAVREYIEDSGSFPEAAEEWFEEALDEDEVIHIGSLVYSPSEVLRKVDPVAWRCGVADYADSLLSDLVHEVERLSLEEETSFMGYGIRKTTAYRVRGKLVEYIQ